MQLTIHASWDDEVEIYEDARVISCASRTSASKIYGTGSVVLAKAFDVLEESFLYDDRTKLLAMNNIMTKKVMDLTMIGSVRIERHHTFFKRVKAYMV